MTATSAMISINGVDIFIDEATIAKINTAISNSPVAKRSYVNEKYIHTAMPEQRLELVPTITIDNNVINIKS